MGLKSAGCKVDHALLMLIRAATGFLLAVMFLVTILSVVFRYVLNSPAFWTEEFARYLMVYMILIGSAAAVRQQQHPALRFIVEKFPRRLRAVWDVTIDTLVFVVLIVILSHGYIMACEEWGAATTALRISFFWVYLALPVGASLMMIQIIAKYVWPTTVADETGKGVHLSEED